MPLNNALNVGNSHLARKKQLFTRPIDFACLEGGVFIWEGSLQVVGTKKYAKHVVKTMAVAENLLEPPSSRNKCKRLISELATEYEQSCTHAYPRIHALNDSLIRLTSCFVQAL